MVNNKEKKCFYKELILLLFPIGLIINYIKWNEDIIEKYYSTTIYKAIVQFVSKVTEFISFSLYEITIITAIIFFIGYLIISIIKLFKNKSLYKKIIYNFLLNISIVISVAYFLYVTMWTLNYQRIPFDEIIGLESEMYTSDELAELYEYLIDETNKLREYVPVDENNIATVYGDYNSILERANLGYEIVSEEYNTLDGNYGNPAKLLFSEFFNYTGITGIYFPYTGQPGVNIKAPLMTVPATTLHEMAHQRGYAREEEANFIAFLVSTYHPDLDFKYSGYILALGHTGKALYNEDPELYEELNENISADVLRDRAYRIDFWDSYSGKIEEAARVVNDTYLKSNGVYDGEKSYGRMVDLLLKYYFQRIKNI